MKRWLAFLPLVALALLAVLFIGYSLKRNPQVQPDAMVGKPMPALSLPDLATGRPVALAQAAKGPVLVNFFASWCAPCEIEHPELIRLQARGVPIVGIAYKDAPDNSAAFIARLGDPFASKLVDRDGRAGLEFGATGVPETFLIASDGTILAKHSGPLTQADSEAMLAKAR
ncbi:MAG: DsbE family thiol:disulfide interchange protein [Caulobacter sp.]|nr:DsbE family thiol:disulfide interchange protein [Caulobacter sp.]